MTDDYWLNIFRLMKFVATMLSFSGFKVMSLFDSIHAKRKSIEIDLYLTEKTLQITKKLVRYHKDLPPFRRTFDDLQWYFTGEIGNLGLEYEIKTFFERHYFWDFERNARKILRLIFQNT